MSKKKITAPNRWTTIYKDILTMQDTPVPQVFIEKLADELVDWASSDEKASCLVQFTSKRRISSSLFANLCAKHPTLFEARKLTQEILGARREQKGLEGEWREGMIKAVQHIYNPEWLESLPYKQVNDAKLNVDITGSNLLHQIVLGNGEMIDVGDERK